MKLPLAAATLLLCVVPKLTTATPATHNTYATTLPDGTPSGEIEKLIGTPGYHFTLAEEAGNGWYPTVLRDDGTPVYALVDPETGAYVPSDVVLGSTTPPPAESFEKYETEAARAAKCAANAYCAWKSAQATPRVTSLRLSGEVRNLVIPIQFSNHGDRTLVPVETIADDLFNDGDMSVEDYFTKQSHGKLQLVSDVKAWVQIPKTEAECAGSDGSSGTSLAIMECLQMALTEVMTRDNIDMETYDQDGDGKFDSLTFVHSGYGAEYGDQDDLMAHFKDRIWSHSWELTGDTFDTALQGQPYAIMSSMHGVANGHVARLGIAVHEIAQMLGAPTTYGEFPGYGLGYWDIMSNPFGFGGTEYNCGNMAAPSKLEMGWATSEEILESAEYSLEHSGLSGVVHQISKGFPSGEYLLIENRQPHGYDADVPQGGLAIYHVDTNVGQVKGGHPQQDDFPTNHYRISLVQADGQYELEQHIDMGDSSDLFHGNNVKGMSPEGAIIHEIEGEENPHVEGHPNTKSYSGGTFKNTGITITDISEASIDTPMTFKVEFGESEAST